MLRQPLPPCDGPDERSLDENEQQGSELKANELERMTTEGLTPIERRNCMGMMRDHSSRLCQIADNRAPIWTGMDWRKFRPWQSSSVLCLFPANATADRPGLRKSASDRTPHCAGQGCAEYLDAAAPRGAPQGGASTSGAIARRHEATSFSRRVASASFEGIEVANMIRKGRMTPGLLTAPHQAGAFPHSAATCLGVASSRGSFSQARGEATCASSCAHALKNAAPAGRARAARFSQPAGIG